ncbi:hypothetical protein GII33_09605 [Gordonia pseudamarae]|jgi:hypothetical protein|uniref:DUF7832 domain-containing protein n=1 Tax=Gordonia pseudamarae TaxID=2831662 RepID=A0ABX6IGV8_9ACTN|nr:MULTISPECIES: hypothetical protein [Gordonia]MBD0020965.1 hypothetical protein [Gordonia sp. (in: high G+C Gram-positive bacteria)]QHN26189.1 hypothetical protein GII33_09605 [Gordonia pseudamarae]QHN35082.1 hypothetical protein GII31_09400 [Gordonia pseudamarae]
MTYDDQSWHGDALDDWGIDDLAAAGTHIGMYYAWAHSRGLVADAVPFHNPGGPPIMRPVTTFHLLTERLVTPGQYLGDYCCGEIDSSMLTDEGNRFTEARYNDCMHAYEALPEISRLPSVYHAEDSWKLFDTVAPVFDREYTTRVGGNLPDLEADSVREAMPESAQRCRTDNHH